MARVLVINIPDDFGGGEVRVTEEEVSYREKGVSEWFPIQTLGGSFQLMETPRPNATVIWEQDRSSGRTMPGTPST